MLYPDAGDDADHAGAVPYTLGLLLPSILLSWYVGNVLGALAARRKLLDNTVLPLRLSPDGDALHVARHPARLGARVRLLGWFPLAFGYDQATEGGMEPGRSPAAVLYHWVLPFASLFMVALGGWAIGMRNMIIYELGERLLELPDGTSARRHRLVRKYAFRNAMLPQITGLALQLGAVDRRRAGHRDRLLLSRSRLAGAVGHPEPGLSSSSRACSCSSSSACCSPT